MPVAYLCDFDGTVSPGDIGASFVRRFSPQPESSREALLERWKQGGIGSRELTTLQCEGLACSAEEALRFTRSFRLDPAFAPFVREARERGDAVMVVSDGFDFYLRDHLAGAGLDDLPWAANRVRFENGGIGLEFPYWDGGCGRCGNCKAQHVRRYQSLGYRSVMIGDGFSDRCGAEVADDVMARGTLLEWCRTQGIAARPFESFADVTDAARQISADAAPGRRRA